MSTIQLAISQLRAKKEETLGLDQKSHTHYTQRTTHTREYWGNKKQYLQQTRLELWNDDYLEFLVSKVWKIVTPVRIIDYGCGDGFLGKKLLPLLPEGSTYTGVDISHELIEDAKQWFAKSPYQGEFIQCDLYEFDACEEYDIACCQAVLRHLPDPKTILRKMACSIVKNGLVVCIEINRSFEIAGMWVEGYGYTPWIELNAMSTLWETELEQEGRDHAIGLKIPGYMKDIGLKQIDMRMNDKVCFLDPTDDEGTYTNVLNYLKAAQGWNASDHLDDQEAITFFESRGMTKKNAKNVVTSKKRIREYIEQHEGEISIVKALCLLISFGYKR